jgi:1L-myo-inositol 1-phosphate cytidylyltransferase
MQAVILAAGMGSRIQDLGSPKPLVMLNGKPLIEHVMERLKEAGVDRFVVVTGYDRQVMEPALDELATRHGWIIATAYNPDWQKPNGVSLLSARKLLAPQFLLTMSDHIVDPALIRIVLDAAKTDSRPVLGVDYDLSNPLVDLADVTRVVVEDHAVKHIGKLIEPYNGFDTGVFIGTHALLDTLEELQTNGAAPSLSDAVQAMSEPIMAVDVSGKMWVDIETTRAYRIVSQLVK